MNKQHMEILQKQFAHDPERLAEILAREKQYRIEEERERINEALDTPIHWSEQSLMDKALLVLVVSVMAIVIPVVLGFGWLRRKLWGGA